MAESESLELSSIDIKKVMSRLRAVVKPASQAVSCEERLRGIEADEFAATNHETFAGRAFIH